MAQAVEGQTQALIELLRGHKRLLVLSHSNPDPDSLASAVGLRLLAAQRADLPSSFPDTLLDGVIINDDLFDHSSNAVDARRGDHSRSPNLNRSLR